MHEPLFNVSSIDGRYARTAGRLRDYFSEAALIKYRVHVEAKYLIHLSKMVNVRMRKLQPEERELLERMHAHMTLEDFRAIKDIETKGWGPYKRTNHDVKAVELWMRHALGNTSLRDLTGWIHFGLTSEDVNNIAYGLLLRDSVWEVILPELERIVKHLHALASEYGYLPMLARTHGQPASPTTFGKEMRVFCERLRRQMHLLAKHEYLVKLNGATGNYNAHVAAFSDLDWEHFSKRFIQSFNRDSVPLKLRENLYTTQIEPHDTYAELFQTMARINTILLDFCCDMWRYISDDWVKQKPVEGEVGSSTMPHKVNPIDFENAEGNLGVATALFEFFARKLPISRLQRDLSDSTVERTFGTAFAHSLIGYTAIERGFEKIAPDEYCISGALGYRPEVVTEGIQTILRREGIPEAYEKLKDFSRGKVVTLALIGEFIDTLPVADAVKEEMRALRPKNYIGLAEVIARN